MFLNQNIYIKLKDRKRSMNKKQAHNVLCKTAIAFLIFVPHCGGFIAH